MRKLPALIVASSMLVALSACSTAPSTSDCSVTEGETSSLITATGDFGTAPQVSFPQPLISTGVESSVLIPGDGTVLHDGQPVIIEATILSGTDGTPLQTTAYDPAGGSLFTVGSDGLAALGEGLECAEVGSRVAIVAPDEAAEGSSSEPIVFVVDVIEAFESRADGVDQLPVAGMPAVVTAPDGTPGITIPNSEAPSDYRTSVLKQGDGEEVGETDAVIVKYTAINWDTDTVAESSWTSGSAAFLQLGGGQVSEGLSRAIAGQTVGSQVLAVIPPDLAGVGGAPAAGTLVYVVDILGTVG
ncbi:FKBP-type peptidyl-prolyl cis-trans isomerase [Marisediminicola sp. LYQ85]|uniref:FKBP-type peptidyl-prolyl cis-trans isomerase n=1 Tax=Marisediminicola sp. LYQ85 TaxID=3391062 RepID=UPI0039838C29